MGKKLFLLLFLITFSCKAFALSIIRDTEVEEVLTDYVKRIFKTVNLPPENAEVVLIKDPSINAFVAGGQTIFVHTGLITSAKSPDDIMFVLSHETGHIIGGHITRGMIAYKKAQTSALISTVLGGLLAVASGRPDAGIAVMIGSQSSALGSFAGYRQTEESSADRVAVDIMNKLGYSMQGFSHVMEKIQAQERLNTLEGGNYLRTHPLTQDRRQNIQRFTQKVLPLHKDARFDRIKAKLAGFLWSPEEVKSHYSGSSLNDVYARAIADYRDHKIKEALDGIKKITQTEKKNPYLYELKGQFEFETGQLDSAISDYQKAIHLLPDAPLIRIALAQALLERGKKEDLNLALENLNRASLKEGNSPLLWQLMAGVYDRLDKPIFADCAMAEYYSTLDKKDKANELAKKIIDDLPMDSTCYNRIKDILDLKKE